MKVIIRYFALYLLIFRDSAKMRTSTHKDAFPASFDEQILEWKDPVLLFYFLKTSNLSFLAAKKSKKRILRKEVWWLDSWRVLEKILLPIGTKPYFALYILFQGFSINYLENQRPRKKKAHSKKPINYQENRVFEF